MKKALLVIMLLCAVFAQDTVPELTGCEDRGSYYLCPQTAGYQSGAIQFTSDLTCGYDGDEEQGCYATARLISNIEYEDCKIYIPNPLTDYSAVKYDYQCTTKTVPSGTSVELLTSSQWVTGCETTDDQFYWHYDTCPTSGQTFDTAGLVSKEAGVYYVVAGTMSPKEGYVDPIYFIAIAAAAAMGAFFLSRQRKKK